MCSTRACRLVLLILAGACGDDDVAPVDAPAADARADAPTAPDGPPAGEAALTIAPNLQDFGSLPLGTPSAVVLFTVTNEGTGKSGTPSTAILGSSDFAMVGDTCTVELDVGETCAVSVRFTPSVLGPISGSLEVTATPGGTASATILGTGVTNEGLVISPTPFHFDDVQVLEVGPAQTFTVTNIGGVSSGDLTTALAGVDATQFMIATNACGGALAPAASCDITVRFAPTSAGAKMGSVTVTASPGGTVAAALSGNALGPANLTVAPTVQSFGSVAAGAASSDLDFTVSNTGDVPTGALASALGGTDPGQFTIMSSTCDGAPLPGGSTCLVRVRFTPSSIGFKAATLAIAGTPGGTAVASLNGAGVVPGQVAISPSPFSFGSTTVGTITPATTFTVTNTGDVATGPLSTALAGGDAGDFPILAGSNGCQGTVLLPTGTCTIAVQFAPTAVGARSASLAVAGTPGGSAEAALSGAGIAPAQLEVTPATQAFGAQSTGTATAPQPFTVRNAGGVASGTPSVTLGGVDFAQFAIVSNGCTAPLAPGATCTVTVRYAPMALGAHAASLTASATPGGTGSAALSGTGVAPADLVVVPTLQSFGTVVEGGSSPTLGFHVSNTGAVPTGPLSTALGGAASGQFAVVDSTCTGSLGAADPAAGGDECDVTVRYAPAAAGSHTASLTVSSSPGGAAVATLNGDAIPGLTLAPASLAFGQLPLDRVSPAQTFTVTNSTGTGAVPRTLSISESFGAPAQFDVSATTCTGGPLAPGTSCTIDVRFRPTGAAGPRSGSLVVGGTGGVSVQGTVGGDAVEGLILTPDPYAFGTVVVGNLTTHVFAVDNLGGAATGVVRTRLSGAGFHVTQDTCTGTARPAFPAPGCTITVMFQPQTPTAHLGALSVSASPGGATSADLSGQGTPPALLTITPGPVVDLGAVRQTNSVSQVFTIRNAAGAAPTSPIDFTFSGAAGFTSTLGLGGSCIDMQTLPSGGSCTIGVTFAPTRASAIGLYEAGLGLSAVQGGTTSSTAAATVLSQIAVTPDPGDFGGVVIGGLRQVTFQVQNGGSAPTTDLVASVADGDAFSVFDDGCATLAAGASCQVVAHFSPPFVGPWNDQLVVADTQVSDAVALQGTGLGLPAVRVDPTWIFFGSTEVGEGSAVQTFRVTNFGEAPSAPLVTSIEPFLFTGSGVFDFVSDGCAGTSLPAQGHCDIAIQFTATASASGADAEVVQLLVLDPLSGPPAAQAVLYAEGRATDDVVLTPGPHDFGALAAGATSAPQTFTFTNNSPVNVFIFDVTLFGFGPGGSDAFAFTLLPPAGPGDCDGTGMVGTDTVPPGGTCAVRATFNPPAGERYQIAEISIGTFPTDHGYVFIGLTGLGVTPPDLVVNPSSHTYDDVAVNGSQTQTFVVQNSGNAPSGGVVVSLGGADVSEFALANGCGLGLSPGDSCTFDVTFQPTSTGAKSAEVVVTDAADPSDLNLVPLMGTAMNPASLSISPGALQSYGAVPVGGASAPRTFTVRNEAGSAPSGPIAMSTGSADFVLAGDGCSGVSLAGGGTCTVDVIYRPTAVESDAAQVSAQAAPGGAAATSLQGSGESALRFTAEPAFSPPAVAVNTNVDRTFVLQNAAAPPGGTAPPTTGFLVTALGDAGGQFAVLLDMCVGRRLAAGDSCTVLIRFTPSTAGPQTGTLNLSSTPGGGDTAALTGQGT